jgi:hypothetical protein
VTDVGDILDVIRQKFAANAAAVSGITGGLHDGRAVGNTVAPYGVVKVAPKDQEYNAAGYLQRFDVRIELYTGTDATATQTAIGLLDTALVSDTRATYTTTTGTAKVLHIRKMAGEWRKEEQRDAGNDVHMAACTYEFLIQG